jgi:hypothetical protein
VNWNLATSSAPASWADQVGVHGLPAVTMIMEARMKARLSTIDARAKPGTKRATRKQRNDPSLHPIQHAEHEAL